VWVFFAIADAFHEHGPMVHIDLSVATWLQVHGNETGESIFTFISMLGAQVLAALLIIAALVLLARGDWRHLIMLAVTAGGGALLNIVLKSAFHRARPTFALEFPVTSSSFPSGHAMDSLIGYGLLVYWLGSKFPQARRMAIMIVVALVALIGFARIYLGVHYLSDVVAGYSAGIIWLMACITGYQFAKSRRLGPRGKDE
jgi:undecaprenyl-diphosphatase